MKKLLVIIASLIMWSPPLNAENVHDAVLKIGIITDLSGVGSYWGSQSSRGAELAATEINAAGEKVSLIVEDATLQSSKAIIAAQKLVSSDHVDALFVEFTPQVIPALPTINNAKVPTIFVAAAESPLEKSAYTFKMYQSYVTGCRDVAKNFVERNLLPLGVLSAQSEFGELCLKGIKEVTDQFTNLEYISSKPVDAEILTLKQKGSKSIITTGFEADALDVFQAMAKINFDVPVGGCKEDTFTEKVIKEFGARTAGGAGFALPELSPVLKEKFVSALAKDHIQLTQPQAIGQAYVAIHLLYQSLASCKRSDTECILKNIAQAKPVADIGFEGFDDRRMGIFKQTVILQK